MQEEKRETTLPGGKAAPRQDSARPPRGEEPIDLIELAAILLDHWWKIVLCGLVCALLAFLFASSRDVPRYRATAKLYVNNNKINIGVTQVSISTSDLSASQQLVEIYRQFMDSHYVLDSIGAALQEKGIEGYNFYTLRGRITAEAAGGTQFMNISAWDTTPEGAIAVINTLVETLPVLAENVIEGSSVTVLDPAYSAVLLGSSVQRDTLRGGLLGAALSAFAVLLYYYMLNDVVSGQDWLLNTYPSTPSLGTVPDTTQGSSGRYGYAYDSQKNSRAPKKEKNVPKEKRSAGLGPQLDFFGTEAYNVVRTNVKFSFYDDKASHVVGITSSMAGDGKSYTSVNLAYALAKDDARVLLIDGDMRKLTLSSYFEKRVKGGLADVLCGQLGVQEAIQSNVLHENMAVMFSGEVPPNPSELLGSDRMRQLLDSLRGSYDYIVLDLPPAGGVIDAVAVSRYLDGMVMLVRHNHTRKKFVRSTLRQLNLAKVRLLGFVYNAETEKHPLYRRYTGKYYAYYGKKKREADQ